MGLLIKKTLQHPKANEEDRLLFQQKIRNYQENNRTIIYIDESGFAEHMPRTHGYYYKGRRCYGKHDWHAKGRKNAIGAQIGKVLLTIGLFECNVNADVFYAWTKQDLLPKLPEKSVVVMDNATFHKRSDLKNLIKQTGHELLYMPAYSPDLNPIEHKWAEAKSIRRKYDCSVEQIFANHF